MHHCARYVKQTQAAYYFKQTRPAMDSGGNRFEAVLVSLLSCCSVARIGSAQLQRRAPPSDFPFLDETLVSDSRLLYSDYHLIPFECSSKKREHIKFPESFQFYFSVRRKFGKANLLL
jgi:hypothetical protein